MTHGSLSDQELVAAARAGGDRAFEELYERYRPRIKGFVLRLTRDGHRADDITQEVFISALRRLRATASPISFRPWIYEIARNACIDDYRHSIRVREVSTDPGTIAERGTSTLAAPAPHVALESKQELEHLCDAFGTLSERHHRVIVLRELEGKTYSQIGDELGISKTVVESTLFRARRRLSEEFEDLTAGRRCEHVQRILRNREDRPVGRLGLRDRRTVSRHLQHCRQCRREAAAAGLDAVRPVPGAVRKVAGVLPVPLIRVLRRTGAAGSSALRSAHHCLQTAAAPLTDYAEAGTSLGYAGRWAASAATVVAAAVGAGFMSETATTSAHGYPVPGIGVKAHRANAAVPDRFALVRLRMPSAASPAAVLPVRRRHSPGMPGADAGAQRSGEGASIGGSRDSDSGGGSGSLGGGGARLASPAVPSPSSATGAIPVSSAELADQREQVGSLADRTASLVSSTQAPKAALPSASAIPHVSTPQAPASRHLTSGALRGLVGTPASGT